MRKKKQYDELTFADSFMFWKVMEEHPDLSKAVLERILGRKLEGIKQAQGEKSLKVSYRSKGIRLDVFLIGDSSTFYDLEMQTTKEPQLPKRMRYYTDVIDLSDLQSGADYEELKEVYIIFICLKDPFKSNLPIYEFRMQCLQDVTVPFENGVHNIIVNAECNREDISPELRYFFQFLKTGKGTDGLTDQLENAVSEAILRDDWRVEYMQFELMLKRERKEGREEGREEGVNLLAEVVRRLRNGESKELIIASGVDEHTVEIAETLK